MRRLVTLVIGGLIGIGVVLALLSIGLGQWLNRTFHSDPTSVARASLVAMREQNRLTPFAARFVAVVTSEQRRWPFTTRKTLIMPGLVRYDVDLAKLDQRDLAWNAATRTLSVTLPAVDVGGLEVDWAATQEFGDGGILTKFTDAEKELDAANRKAGQTQLLAQAHDVFPMRLARNAARSAIERSFALPLKAAGIEATVAVRFADEPKG